MATSAGFLAAILWVPQRGPSNANSPFGDNFLSEKTDESLHSLMDAHAEPLLLGDVHPSTSEEVLPSHLVYTYCPVPSPVFTRVCVCLSVSLSHTHHSYPGNGLCQDVTLAGRSRTANQSPHHGLSPHPWPVFSQMWQHIASNKRVLDILSTGYISLCFYPESPLPIPLHGPLSQEEVDSLIQLGTIDPLPPQCRPSIPDLSLSSTKKRGMGWRPILDLRQLNIFIHQSG